MQLDYYQSKTGLTNLPNRPVGQIGKVVGIRITWSQTFMGGGCTVTLSGPWTNTQNDRKCTKNTFE